MDDLFGGTDVGGPSAVDLAFEAYNVAASKTGWPHARVLNDPRRRKLGARLSEVGLTGWQLGLMRAARSDFLCGRTGRESAAFMADLDFFLQASSFVKLIEGKYDNRKEQRSAAWAALDNI